MQDVYVIDFEGYKYQNKFYVKEFAVYNLREDSFKNYFVDVPNLFYDNYYWLVNYFHKIHSSYNVNSVKFSKIKEILNSNATFLIKGREKYKILQEVVSCELVDIEELGCPAYKKLNNPEVECSYSEHYNCDHCALKKVHKIVHWLKNERLDKIFLE